MKDQYTADAIRKAYLDFFASRGHTVTPSDSLVPQNDPSLLFTGAGMNQFKEYFLGVKKDLKRAVSSQKCLRTGDLDEVGRTPYHHSFFEMLGNFSFGDYFKKEAIIWAWEFLTTILSIPKERLRITVHENDQEACDLWRKEIGLPEEWIYKCGDKSNFWPANAPKDGPNGPCGPCSEIYYDLNPSITGTPVDDSGKYAEIWNLVFTQYDRQEGGKLVPLKARNIDTGMGLERLACVLQGKSSNFEIDLFQPIHEAILKSLGIAARNAANKPLYCIADHLRAVVFSISDGAVPSNEGRGYVVRKLIRRAIWQAHRLNPKIKKPFLCHAMSGVIAAMKPAYPELSESEENVRTVLRQEEERFLKTLESGLKILGGEIHAHKKAGKTVLSADSVFELYDTYGFPEELTRMIAESEGFSIDRNGFEKLMEAQRSRSKESSKIAAEIFAKSDLEKIPSHLPGTVFLGYDTLAADAKVLWCQIEGNHATVILDRTPFYAESGGQIGDQGMLESDCLAMKVLDTKKLDKYFLHRGEILRGVIENGAAVEARVDIRRRAAIMRNHTATHLLHAALRQSLGGSVRQLGSMVAPDRLRFDYSFGRALTAEELATVETAVNERIIQDLTVHKYVKKIADAKKEGALAFFGDKYGETVRMIDVPDFSKELCGGTHCDRTGEIGFFLITSESSVASGVRRIEAVTGLEALRHVRAMQGQLAEIAKTLKVGIADIPMRLAKLQESVKKQKAAGNGPAVSGADARRLIASAREVRGCRILLHLMEGAGIPELRGISDTLRDSGQKLVFIVASTSEGKLSLLAGISNDLKKSSFDMKALFGRLSGILQVTGGGRPDLVQGGGPDHGQFQASRDKIEGLISEYLTEKGL
ncbi:MAG: Alanine--tRNA ligase [Candidatus Omnitrophica bacterium ADurb.Bin314]|nr:MAG: Alanine--tRNA ligase [Candidatus Omnitrophica bacterium ADurb.Bin314]HOE69197.1 alanine--tRNA ligase [Candidatus Omnitrophota bacterium]